MRYWGKNIEIDASFYTTAMGKSLAPTPAELAQFRATNNLFQNEGNVEVYEVTIQNMMRDIDNNMVGTILIDAINRAPKTVRIIPLTLKEEMRKKPLGPCNNGVKAPSGTGNDSVIWFEPWSTGWNLIYGGTSPYQILVHELQHALRTVRGKIFAPGFTTVSRFTGPGGIVNGFPNLEELFSVTFENMFLSALGQPQRMRNTYNPITPLNNRSDRDWYKQHGAALDVWCDDFRDLTPRLEGIFGIWNPIRVRRMVLDGLVTL
ncbi:hypothetical protein AYO44_09665 [Planctomycetaceae bacterium SCGC AG-212-F19]|nr:hypothetical protein AYO44_09665 [Planctomycetaceae bacterium SCGC AG-212-F19]